MNCSIADQPAKKQMIITSTEQAKEGELVQLRKVAALVKSVAEKAEKATQSVPMKNIQEEVVKEEKVEETEVKAEEDIIDVKNVAQVLPLRRSARAARMAIVKVDQVEFSDPFFYPYLFLFLTRLRCEVKEGSI